MSDYLVRHIIQPPQGVLKAASWRKLPPAVSFGFDSLSFAAELIELSARWQSLRASRIDAAEVEILNKSVFRSNFSKLPFHHWNLCHKNRRREQIGFLTLQVGVCQ